LRFTPQQTRAVLDSRQTMTHVIAHPSRTATRRNGTTYETVPFVPKVGLRIPFSFDDPRAGDPDHRGRAHIVVTACAAEPAPIGAVTAEEAKAAGHRSPEALSEWWVRQHDKDWVARRERRETEQGRDPKVFLRRVIGQRFAQRHADTLVWPIRFRLDITDEPTFLLPAARGDQGDGVLGYTHNVARALDDVETVDLDSGWETAADARHAEARGDQDAKRLARSIGSQVRENLLAAHRAGVDIAPDVAALQRAVTDLDRRRDAA